MMARPRCRSCAICSLRSSASWAGSSRSKCGSTARFSGPKSWLGSGRAPSMRSRSRSIPRLGLKPLIQRQRRWTRITPDLEAFEAMVTIPTWKRSLRIAIYRRRLQHESPKNFQLDLFDPDDGHWEYSAITTNKPLGLKALWKFMAGRGTHEKVLAQLKHGYAFETIPTRNFAANSTWQILSVLAHNLITNFQIALASPQRPASAKRRSLFRLRSIHTLRYELLGRAGTTEQLV